MRHQFGAAFAVGVDIDSEAIASAYQNAALNNIGPDKMQLQLIASENSLSSEEETTSEIQAVTGQYDVVIANILLNPLLNIADQIISCAKPGAVVGLSGILSEQVILAVLIDFLIQKTAFLLVELLFNSMMHLSSLLLCFM